MTRTRPSERSAMLVAVATESPRGGRSGIIRSGLQGPSLFRVRDPFRYAPAASWRVRFRRGLAHPDDTAPGAPAHPQPTSIRPRDARHDRGITGGRSIPRSCAPSSSPWPVPARHRDRRGRRTGPRHGGEHVSRRPRGDKGDLWPAARRHRRSGVPGGRQPGRWRRGDPTVCAVGRDGEGRRRTEKNAPSSCFTGGRGRVIREHAPCAASPPGTTVEI